MDFHDQRWLAPSYLGPAAWRPLGAAGGRRGSGTMGGTILPGAGSLEAPGSGGRAAWERPHGRHHLNWGRLPGWRPLGAAGGRPHGRHHLTWGRQPGGPWERGVGGEGAAPWAAPSCRPAAASAALTSSHSPAANPASVSQSTQFNFSWKSSLSICFRKEGVACKEFLVQNFFTRIHESFN
jgi:hypothetical protein